MDFPGGAVKFASYNATALVSDVTKGYVIPTSYFGNVYNITAVEVVAVTQGQLAIDVSNEKDITQTIENLEKWHIHFFQIVRPKCQKNMMWCSITKKCEKKCITDFEALEKIDAIHACHFTADAQFCSNEETCQKALTCPNSIMKGQYLIRRQIVLEIDVNVILLS